MSSDDELLDTAAAAYMTALYHSDVSASARVEAARQFRTITAEMDDAGAQPSFLAATTGDDDQRRDAAIRALVDSRSQDAIERLLDIYVTQGPPLKANLLKKISRRVSLPDGAWDMIERVRPLERGTMIEVFFVQPTAEAERRWHQLIADEPDAYVVQRAIRAVAHWGRLDLLRPLLDATRRGDPEAEAIFDVDLDVDIVPLALRTYDIRLPVAFELALRGDADAVEFLTREASESTAAQSVDATRQLAYLGMPVAVELTSKHLLGSNQYASAMALSAAGCLGSPGLGAALCALVERAISTSTDALNVLESMTGRVRSEPHFDDPDPAAVPPAMRKRAVIVQRTALADLEPSLRYRAGRPLTLGVLVGDLSSRHQGPIINAAYALRALTGEDFGFDPDDDLIGNLDAIEAWRAFAGRPPAAGPGEWAFRGKPLLPPAVPT